MWWDLALIDHLLEATVQTFIFPSQVLNKILLLGLDPLPTYLSLQTKKLQQHSNNCATARSFFTYFTIANCRQKSVKIQSAL